jgi:hypothetical protein
MNEPAQSQPQSQEQGAAQPSQQSQGQQSSFTVPEAFADKEWAKNIKSPDDLWNQFSNAQSLLGKRPAGAPLPDAPDEEWERFYTAAGRPESPDKYQLSDIEGLPEGVDLSPYKQKASAILHAAGLNPKQADKVWKQYIQSELEAVNEAGAKSKESQAALDAEFDKYTKEVFGENADAEMQQAVSFANSIVPESVRGVAAGLADNPKALAYVAAIAKGAQKQIADIKKQYGAEDALNSGGQSSGFDIESTRKELAVLRTSAAAKDFLHGDHKQTMDRINALSASVASYYKK